MFFVCVPTADFSGGAAEGSDQSHKDALQERLFLFFIFLMKQLFKAQFLLHPGGGGRGEGEGIGCLVKGPELLNTFHGDHKD